jgi:predicted  nucleic acid-binding Zn-ribbon protein
MQQSTRIAELWRLQEIDSALDARQGSLDDARSRLGESEELTAARDRVAECTITMRSAQAAQKDLELQADELRAKISPLETKLYSGSIRNPKELKDLQADIDQLKRQLSAIEDRDLEALAVLERAQEDVRNASDEAATLEQAWRDEQADLTERVTRLAAEIDEYQARRREQAEGIGRDVLATYDHVRRAHQGKGVAKVDRNICTGCRISLPVSTVNKARAGSALVHCPNCERILFA